MRTIMLKVSDEVALWFEKLTPEQKQSAAETLAKFMTDSRPLFEVSEVPSEYAKKQSITDEILKGLNDEVVERLLAMDSKKRSLALKFIADLEKKSSWKELFVKTAEQAEKQGLTEEKLRDLLNNE